MQNYSGDKHRTKDRVNGVKYWRLGRSDRGDATDNVRDGSTIMNKGVIRP